MNKIILGKEYKDVVTGFKGIAVARTEWLNGCARVTIQPKMGKDGKCPANETFDEPQVIFVGKREVKRGNTNTGGPLPFEIKQKEI